MLTGKTILNIRCMLILNLHAYEIISPPLTSKEIPLAKRDPYALIEIEVKILIYPYLVNLHVKTFISRTYIILEWNARGK